MVTITKKDILYYKDTVVKLLNLEDRYVEVVFDDKTEKIRKSYVIIYLYIWNIIIEWDMIFKSEYRFDDTVVTSKTITKLLTKIYDDSIDQLGHTYVQYSFWKVLNGIRKFILRHCNKYHTSLSRTDLARLMKQDKVRKITDNLNIDENTQTKVVEKALTDNMDKFMDLLKKEGELENNVLYPYIRLGLVNTKQIGQMLLAVGTRADINDLLITYPIKSSFYNGIKTIQEALVEFTTAKKAAFYNKAGVPDASVYSKSLHLITSKFKYIYPDDCGNETYLSYHVIPKSSKNLIGKKVKFHDKEFIVDHTNHQDIDGRTISVRTICGCKHKDGFCASCAGHAAYYYPNNIKVGMVSSVALSRPTVQKVLSAKHFQSTTTVLYKPDKALSYILNVKENELFINPSIVENFKEKYLLAIPVNYMSYITDLFNIDDLSAINEDYFSTIVSLTILNKKDRSVEFTVNDMSYNKTYPFFSQEFLQYIKDNYDEIEIIDDHLVIDIGDFDTKQAIMRTPVINDSIMMFVDKIKNFSGANLRSYKSLSAVFKDLSYLIYHKTDINFIHLEAIIRANLITNRDCYVLPIINPEDIDKTICMGSNEDIIVNQSIGTLLEYGKSLFDKLAKPQAFTVPRQGSDYDKYLNL